MLKDSELTKRHEEIPAWIRCARISSRSFAVRWKSTRAISTTWILTSVACPDYIAGDNAFNGVIELVRIEAGQDSHDHRIRPRTACVRR